MKIKVPKKDKDVLKRHAYLFKAASTVGSQRRKKILKNAPNSLYKASKILAKHLIKGNIPLKQAEKKKMTPLMKKILREIHSARSASRVVKQNGAGFSQVLRFVLPIIGPLLSSI